MTGDEDNLELPPAEEVAGELPPEEAQLAEMPSESVNIDELRGETPMPVPEGESVEALLAEESLPDAGNLLADLPEPAPAAPEQPTFQLQFRSLTDEARAVIKKAAEVAGATVSDKAWAVAVPVLSQLTEYQAVVLLQAARSVGVAADAQVVLPGAAPTEEDLALGDLSAVPEAPAAALESAPSVELPKGEKEVLLCTPDRLPGGTVRETFGIVIAHRSIARRLFREDDLRDKLQKELRSVPQRAAMGLPSSQLQILLRDLLLDLRKSALAKGANAVLGVKLEAFPESGHSDPQLEQLRLVAFGTAAVVEKS